MASNTGPCPFKPTGLVAGADLSALQYTFVKVTSAGVVAVAAVTDQPVGVLANKPTSGRPAEIVAIGQVPVEASATIAAGDFVFLAADGTVDKTTTSTPVGQAMSGGASGELVQVLVNVTNVVAGAGA
jgi:hypothetical protein